MPTPAKKKPTDPPENDEGNEEVPDFTPAQLEIINNTITSAVSQHVKRHMKPLTDQLAGLTTIQEQLEALTAAQVKQAPAKKEAGAAGKEGAQPEENAEVAELRKKLDGITKERERERIKARDSERDRKLSEVATAAGVDKNRLRGATALLREQVKYDREGNAIMTVKRAGVDEDVDLETGASEFFKTDEGKSYLAPSQQGAGGARGAAQQRTSAASVAGGAARSNAGGSSNAAVRGADQQRADRKADAMKQLSEGVTALLGGGGSLEIG